MMCLRYIGQRLTQFVVTIFTNIIIACTHLSPLNKALNYAGDNHAELEARILSHMNL